MNRYVHAGADIFSLVLEVIGLTVVGDLCYILLHGSGLFGATKQSSLLGINANRPPIEAAFFLVKEKYE